MGWLLAIFMLNQVRSLLRIIAALSLLLVILLSIRIPPFSPSEISSHSLNLNMARDFTCMETVIPSNSDVLFAADPNTPRMPAQYYRSQFFLAPRLVIMSDPADLEDQIDYYDWIIETNPEAEPFQQLNHDFQLAVIRDCDFFFVLHKTPQP